MCKITKIYHIVKNIPNIIRIDDYLDVNNNTDRLRLSTQPVS